MKAEKYSITTKDFEMQVFVHKDGQGEVKSSLHASAEDVENDGQLQHYETAINALEALILAPAEALNWLRQNRPDVYDLLKREGLSDEGISDGV